jgi:GNAT superfamily N-acetyltransferase
MLRAPSYFLREVADDEREALRTFVCDAHVEASGYSPAARAAQIADLATDFPELHSESAWAERQRPTSWVAIDAADRTTWVGAVGLKRSCSRVGAEDLSFLFVIPSRHRCGIGRALLTTALDAARARAAVSVRLLTLPGVYDAALSLYESVGFRAYRGDEKTPEGFFNLRWLELTLSR